MIDNSFKHFHRDLLPIHPLPFSDELLSSWLVRLAHSNHFKVHTFCRLFIGEKYQIWNRDIDVSAPKWLIEAIQRITCLSKNTIEQTTMKSFEAVIFDNIYFHAVNPWLLPLGIYHRARTLHGLQYCPKCLALDERPYFRKQWRLSFYTVCEFHHILMHDQCPVCHSPVVFHRNDIGFNKESFNNIVVCHICGLDLSHSPIQAFEHPNPQILMSLLKIYKQGWTNYPLPQIMYSPIFLRGLRIILSLLVSVKKKAQLSLRQIELDIGEENERELAMSIPFERRRIHERHRLLMVALWLLLDWPQHFEQYYKKFELTKSIIFQDIPNPPYFLVKAIDSF